MNNKIKKYQIFCVIITFIIGTVLQFTFKWANENLFVASFSTVNESVWEHLKLIYFPSIIGIILGCFYLKKEVNNFLCSKVIGMLISISFIIIFFYTYTGILGKDIAFIDIASFFVSVIIQEYISYKLIISAFSCNNKIALIVLILLFVCFVLFTYMPPHIGIFSDYVTKKYGIIKE